MSTKPPKFEARDATYSYVGNNREAHMQRIRIIGQIKIDLNAKQEIIWGAYNLQLISAT